jgi:hypothetical protein
MLSCAQNMKYSLFSFSIRSLKSHGERWPRGSMETIFFLSAHWGCGPMLAAGSVLVKSGLDQESVFPCSIGFSVCIRYNNRRGELWERRTCGLL